MSLKTALKSAKQAIADNDPETVLEHVEDALEIDPRAYYAHIFAGKAHLLLNNLPLAIDSFKTATEIDPDNILGWKAYLQAAKASDNYDLAFSTLTRLLAALVRAQESTADAVRDFKNWLDRSNFRNNKLALETYLKWASPSTELISIVGPNSAFGNAVDNLRQLLDMRVSSMDADVAKQTSRERIKYGKVLGRAAQQKMDEFTWGCYQGYGDVDDLYKQYLDVCDDDVLRPQYQDKQLAHTYTLLECAPQDQKDSLRERVKEMVDTAVMIRAPSARAWGIHFDWLDPKSLANLEQEEVAFYVKQFPREPLAMVLRAFACSALSPFDQTLARTMAPEPSKRRRRRGRKDKNRKSGKNDEKNDKESNDKESHDKESNGKESNDKDSSNGEPSNREPSNDSETITRESSNESVNDKENLTASALADDEPSVVEQVLPLLVEGYRRKNDSVLIARIVSEYCIHLREYEQAAAVCKQAVTVLADMQRGLGIALPHSQESFLCALATTYTYHEAPKHHGRAIQLFRRVLESNPDNMRAQVGSGLIHMERGEYSRARTVLERVRDADREAATEYGWCLVRMGEYSRGREVMEETLARFDGRDVYQSECRGRIHYRIACAYVEEEDIKGDDDKDLLDSAFQSLLLSVEESPNFAPAYTLLGKLLSEHYGDTTKAHKCFTRAFELDALETDAARALVTQLAGSGDWEIADILCTRVVLLEAARRRLHQTGSAWPYRAMGSSALNRQDDAKAVEWFQSALRIDAGDRVCWIGLGEAYLNLGRLDAAAKVFTHVREMDDSNGEKDDSNGEKDDSNLKKDLSVAEDAWIVEYMLGVAVCRMGEFEEGLTHLNLALVARPNELCVLAALYETHTEYLYKLVGGGFFGRAAECAAEAVEYVARAAAVNPVSPSMWKCMMEAMRVFLVVKEQVNVFPVDVVKEVLDGVNGSDVDGVDGNEDFSTRFASDPYRAVGDAVVEAAVAGLKHLPPKSHKYLVSAAHYNIGLALLERGRKGNERSEDEVSAITSFKRALQLEDNNAAYWVALGCAYVRTQPAMAQHCFIRALSLDARDVGVWTNLASLYLRYGDVELAQQAFLRAQLVGPQHAASWVGHAVCARTIGDDSTARRLFAHALVLANGRVPLALLTYGALVVSWGSGNGASPRDAGTAQAFGVANFAMAQYLKHAPNDAVALAVALTVAERCKDWARATTIGNTLCECLAAEYAAGDDSAAGRLAAARAQLARVYLGNSDYDSALEIAEKVLGDEGEDEDSSKLSLRVVIALAHFFCGRFEEALEQMRAILAVNGALRRLVALVAQMLHAEGSEDCRQAAVDELFAHIESHGPSLVVVLTLGAILMADGLEDYLLAIKEELEGLALDELVSDRFRTVPRLLELINAQVGADDRLWQRNAVMFPLDFGVWMHLSREVAVTVGSLSDSRVAAGDMARALEGGSEREQRRAKMLSPV